MTMLNDKMRFIVILVIAFLGFCSGQETDAERDGRAIVSVSMPETDFASQEQRWRDTMAWHASMHCKKGKNNCWASDKQIRYHDVIIMDILEIDNGQSVEIIFHIRDRYDHTKAGLSGQQVRSFFLDYEGQMEEAFNNEQMSLVSPGEEGMEGWLIAVITISCVLGLALIVTVAVLASKQHKLKKQQKIEAELNKQRLQGGLLPDYIILPDGKINPGYDSDQDKPTTSVLHSKRNSTVGREPPPAYLSSYNPDKVSTSELKQEHQDRHPSDVTARTEESVSVYSESSPKEGRKAEDSSDDSHQESVNL